MYFEAPDGATFYDGNLDLALDKSVAGMLAEVNATLTSQQNIVVQACPGRHVTAEGFIDEGVPVLVDANVIIVGRRVYMVMAAVRRASVDPYTIDRFQASFFLMGDLSSVEHDSSAGSEGQELLEALPDDFRSALEGMPAKQAEATLMMMAALEEENLGQAREALQDGAHVDIEIGGRPLIFLYVRDGQASAVRFLLEHGASHGSRTSWGRTPLHEAALYGHYEVARVLIDHGADVNAVNPRGESPLFYARGGIIAGPRPTKDHARVEELLLSRGARQ